MPSTRCLPAVERRLVEPAGSVKVARHLQHQGRGGEDDRGGQPRLRGGRAGARVLLWDLDPQGAATFFFRIRPGFKGGAERLIGHKGELAEHVKESDLAGLHLVPADFSLRHLDLHLDEVEPLDPAPRRRCSSRSPSTTTSRSSTARLASR